MIGEIAYVDRLEAVGVLRSQAQVHLELMNEVVKSGLVTREQFAVANQDLRSEFAGLRGEFAALKSDFAGLKGEFAGLKGDFAELKGEFGVLRGDFAELKAAFAKFANDMELIEMRLFFKLGGLMVTLFSILIAILHFSPR